MMINKRMVDLGYVIHYNVLRAEELADESTFYAKFRFSEVRVL